MLDQRIVKTAKGAWIVGDNLKNALPPAADAPVIFSTLTNLALLFGAGTKAVTPWRKLDPTPSVFPPYVAALSGQSIFIFDLLAKLRTFHTKQSAALLYPQTLQLDNSTTFVVYHGGDNANVVEPMRVQAPGTDGNQGRRIREENIIFFINPRNQRHRKHVAVDQRIRLKKEMAQLGRR
jgi:hypothetical protein